MVFSPVLRKVFKNTQNLVKDQRVWAIAVAIAAIVTGIYLWSVPVVQRLNQPDRALALFAVSWVWAAWAQQVTNLRGLSYIFGTETIKKNMDKEHCYNPRKGWWQMFLRITHWGATVFMLLLVVQLAYGAYREATEQTTIETLVKQNQQLNLEVVESKKELIAQVQASKKELIDRIDKVLEQNTQMLKRLEAQNVPRKYHYSKVNP